MDTATSEAECRTLAARSAPSPPLSDPAPAP